MTICEVIERDLRGYIINGTHLWVLDRLFPPEETSVDRAIREEGERLHKALHSENRRRSLKRIKDSQSTEPSKIAVMAAHRRLMLQCQSSQVGICDEIMVAVY